jgi:uncharacterized protein (DUF983 family)
MIHKGTHLYSILHQKCPKCQEGDMFKYSTVSIKFMEMNKTCPCCGFDFVQEPSFYFGAMYVSYAIQVAVFVGVYLALRITIDPASWVYMTSMVLGAVVILPLNFRWSRVTWLNFFTSYDQNALEKS